MREICLWWLPPDRSLRCAPDSQTPNIRDWFYGIKLLQQSSHILVEMNPSVRCPIKFVPLERGQSQEEPQEGDSKG